MPGMRVQVPEVTDYKTMLDEAWVAHLAPRAADAPTVASLFAGCGGSSLGYSMAGFREVLAVEWDAKAAGTFRLNFPGVAVREGDVHDLSVADFLGLCGLAVGELDVLDGSPPCQGFSTAGKREYFDPRNQLYNEFVRLLEGAKPKAFVMENVWGMVKGKMKVAFADCTRKLKAAGYRVSCRLLDAQWFRVPQTRKRLIWIGIRDDLSVAPSHPAAEHRPISVREALVGLPEMQNELIDHVWIDESPAERNTATYHLALKAKQGQKYAGHQRRTVWNDVFPTILTASAEMMKISPYLRNSNCHPLHTRTFSIRENARGSSFPDGFRFVGTLFDKQSRIGSAVPPMMMRAIASHVRSLLAQADGHAHQAGAGVGA